jgi:hypothetical protein
VCEVRVEIPFNPMAPWKGAIIGKEVDGRDKAIQSLHSDKQGIRFQEYNNIDKDKGDLPGPFQP